MCGIFGYIGQKKSIPVLLKGLERLEYRGYDSAGLAVFREGKIHVYKKQGKVENLKTIVEHISEGETSLGIAHTRWATHGVPNDINSHPHSSNSGKITLVHNGIIENNNTLKEALQQRGYQFVSETDTEVLPNLIEEAKKHAATTEEAVQLALAKVIGAYGLAIINEEEPDQLIVARRGSPIVIGIGDQEFFVASDAAPIIEYTDQAIYLEDGEMIVLHRDGSYKLISASNEIHNPEVKKLDLDLETIEKGGFAHFMLKEIYEQPKAISDSTRGRLNTEDYSLVLGGISDYEDQMLKAPRLIIVACGTSWHAALTGEYFIEELTRIPVEVEYASEFRYRNPVITKNDIVIAISQSGETADTLAAIAIAKEKGATILGICNVVGSSLARLVDAGLYTHAGHEIGVASTKAYTTQLSALLMLALRLGSLNGNLDTKQQEELVMGLHTLPHYMDMTLKTREQVFALAETFVGVHDVFYLGRGYGFPTALEGALKLKEISYIHAEGYPAAEMKHGPIALIDQGMPVIFIATDGRSLDKVMSNMEEIKARGGRVIAIATAGSVSAIHTIAEEVIEISSVPEILVPFLATIPLQLLAYQIAVLRHCDVDKPRNLAKSVTVE